MFEGIIERIGATWMAVVDGRSYPLVRQELYRRLRGGKYPASLRLLSNGQADAWAVAPLFPQDFRSKHESSQWTS